jgi:hypothetical protein
MSGIMAKVNNSLWEVKPPTVYVRPVDQNYRPPEDIGAWIRVYDPDQQ